MKNTKNRRLKRKQQQKRMKLIFLTLTAMFIMTIGISVFSMNANANSAEGASDYKYYGSYCIEHGDTLWSIAEKNIDYNHYRSIKEYAKEIQKINKIPGEHITSGTYIIIPYFSDELK